MLNSIISLYKNIQGEINKSTSGKCKFNLILSFISDCEKVFNTSPPAALTKDFVSVLLDVILKSDISFTDPAKLNTAKIMLSESRNSYEKTKGGEVIAGQINKAIDILNMQMLKSYFYLGKYDDGLMVLKNMLEQREIFFGEKDEGAKKEKKSAVEATNARYALVNPEIYKESKAYEILTEIKNELERLNSHSDTSVNILLVEHDSKNAGFSGGTIQNLLCSTVKAVGQKKAEIEFENITDIDDAELEDTMKEISYAANGLIKAVAGKSVPANTKRVLKFQNIKGVYRGSSLGLGGAVVSACNYFNYSNSKKRYKISNAAAFTGVVDKDGKVAAVSRESISDKIEAAFFSWVKYCVVPKENYNDAVEECEKLKRIYPTKEIEVFGIETVEEVFKHTELIRTEILDAYEYTRSLVERNKIKSLAALIVVLVIATAFLSSKFLPKDIKPLPRAETEMYLIYTPDRDTEWIFHNENYFGGDTINFGDVAIGDQWFPAIEFWNNDRKAKEFNVYIDGKDKEEFQLTWMYKNEQPKAPKEIMPNVSQMLFVKFVPTKEEGKKNAVLVFEHQKDKRRKEISLKGESKRLNGGYCINIEEPDDELVLEPNMNMITTNTTISLWIKPYYRDTSYRGNIFVIENNPLSNNKLFLYVHGKEKIGVEFARSKSGEVPINYYYSDLKVNFNQWNYLALSLSDTSFTLVVNDEKVTRPATKNYLRILNDCMFFGIVNPSMRTDIHLGIMYLKYYLDEFKIYNESIPAEDLIKNRNNSNFKIENLLASYDFDDATPKRVFDKSANDFWPRLYGGVKRVIDENQPFAEKKEAKKTNKTKNTVFKRSGKGYLKLNKNIFLPKTSFTLQCDFKYENYKKSDLTSFLYARPFFINRSGLDVEFYLQKDSISIRIINAYKNFYFDKGYFNEGLFDWKRFTLSYDAGKNELSFYLNGKILHRMIYVDILNIENNYMGISFANYNYYAAPRLYSIETYVDNIKLYKRAISSSEIYYEEKEGLIAYWTFENTDKELAYDEVLGLPLLMIEPYELVEEEVKTGK